MFAITPDNASLCTIVGLVLCIGGQLLEEKYNIFSACIVLIGFLIFMIGIIIQMGLVLIKILGV